MGIGPISEMIMLGIQAWTPLPRKMLINIQLKRLQKAFWGTLIHVFFF